MKKILIVLMLLLTTSGAMAQFGRIEDLGKKTESSKTSGKDGQGDSESTDLGDRDTDFWGGRQNGKTQLLDQTLNNAFMLISQEYQVEDANIPGSRYNWGQDQWFGKNTSFIVRLTDGFITTKNIMKPEEDDENFQSLQGTFIPHMSKSSVLLVGDTEWKEEKIFDPKNEKELDNGLYYVTDSQWGEGGLRRATGTGKRIVYVVWMEVGEGDPAMAKSVRFKSSQTEIEIVEDKTLYDLKVPNTNGQVMGGIVVEAFTDGMGQLRIDLWGVAVKDGDTYQMALIDSDMGKDCPSSAPAVIEMGKGR